MVVLTIERWSQLTSHPLYIFSIKALQMRGALAERSMQCHVAWINKNTVLRRHRIIKQLN